MPRFTLVLAILSVGACTRVADDDRKTPHRVSGLGSASDPHRIEVAVPESMIPSGVEEDVDTNTDESFALKPLPVRPVEPVAEPVDAVEAVEQVQLDEPVVVVKPPPFFCRLPAIRIPQTAVPHDDLGI